MAPKVDVNKLENKLSQLNDEINDLAEDLKETHRLSLTIQTEPDQLNIFKARMLRFENTFDKFIKMLAEAKSIADLVEDQESAGFLSALRVTIRGLFYEVLAVNLEYGYGNAREPIAQTPTLDHTLSTPDRGPFIKLPTVKLPNFDGNVSEWLSFRDTFVSLIHQNPDLTNIQKFHYLKSSLQGIASQCISSIALTADGYTQAWTCLQKKYDNKRIQATNYLIKIFNFKPLQKYGLNSIETFAQTVLESSEAYLNLNLSDPAGFILYTLGLRLLDNKTRERFEMDIGAKHEFPTFKQFSDFIHTQSVQLQSDTLTVSLGTGYPTPNSSPKYPKPARQIMMSTDSEDQNDQCRVCKGSHKIYRCETFRALSPFQRYLKVKALRLCHNCLSHNHTLYSCSNRKTCFHCHKKHHSLLHLPDGKPTAHSLNNTRSDRASSSPSPPQNQSKLDKSSPSQSSSDATTSSPETAMLINVKLSATKTDKEVILAASSVANMSVLLGTVIALIEGSDGSAHPIRVLLDSGSQRSFVSAGCARRLNLKRTLNPHSLRGISDSPIPGGNYNAKCVLSSKFDNQIKLETNAVIISKITETIPICYIPKETQTHFRDMILADPTYWRPGPIDFLLGADLFTQILTGKTILTDKGLPNALQTIFGWVIMGPMEGYCDKEPKCNTIVASKVLNNQETLDNLLQKFWELEVSNSEQRMSAEDRACEEYFRATHSRDQMGRYMVRLPFKESPNLGNSYDQALCRFKRLESQLNKNPVRKNQYSDVLKSYLEEEYISLSVDPGKYYLPHRGVYKESVTTPVRIVFDASAATSHGSINDKLYCGAKLHLDIRNVILNFRRHPIVMTTDICQMFLRVLIHPEDRAYQHFLYRFDPEEAISDFKLNRLIFGMSCSPYLSIRVLRQLVEDEGLSFPAASDALLNHIYVDDILTGSDSLEGALTLQKELILLLGKGGFKLKKWSSNHSALLQDVDSDQNEIKFASYDDHSVKLLGLKWDPVLDNLSYKIEKFNVILTKRGVMSAVARMYDPLGYLAPVIFKAKTILQQLWALKLNWDDNLPDNITYSYQTFFDSLLVLQKIKINRCILPSKPLSVILVGFADASVLGYAAIIYLRMVFPNNKVEIYPIIAKTRLAPLKSISIPRLELCAALLLVQTIDFIKDFLKKIPLQSTYLFTDSNVVLSWLLLSPNTLKTFVGNRVTAILDESAVSDWYHVSTNDNAADVASRGINASELLDHQLWWRGPNWLTDDVSNWPITRPSKQCDAPEVKPNVITLVNQEKVDYIIKITERYSSFLKLIRILAFVNRFVFNARATLVKRRTGYLSIIETKAATRQLIKCVQIYYFPANLSENNSTLVSLNPFRDAGGLLRVGGRLANSNLSYDAKHPVLIPSKSYLAKLVVDHFHKMYLHAGPTLLNSMLRRQYWIINGRRLIRSRIFKCTACYKFRAKGFTPIMGNLPTSRFAQGRPFIVVGVDFAGPFNLKESKRRNAHAHKCYLAMFICMVTKAVHVEIVSQLSTDAFLACLQRFVGRRGKPSKIMSDNGTNFVGASNSLKDLYKLILHAKDQDWFANFLNENEIVWEFIPPSTPHFGGMWEAGIRMFKNHLNRTLPHHNFTFEELNTIAIRIEAVLNSRPMVPVTSLPDDFDSLTPGHFIIGGPLIGIPERDLRVSPENTLSRWQVLNKCVQSIWQSWRRDYLNNLQQRYKWNIQMPNIKQNTLVLLKDKNSPPLHWPMGRVIEVFPGSDGIVRVVKLNTQKGECIRPASKLIPLFAPD